MKEPKIFILGTGRAGTSFLMEIIKELGYDINKHLWYCNNSRSGYEIPTDNVLLNMAPTPYIIKNPALSLYIPELYKHYEIEHIYIPVRNMSKAVESRNKAKQFWGGSFWPNNLQNGFPSEEKFLTYLLGKIIHDCVMLDIEYSLLKYPNIKDDCNYLYDSLSKLVVSKNYNRYSFEKIFKKVVK